MASEEQAKAREHYETRRERRPRQVYVPYSTTCGLLGDECAEPTAHYYEHVVPSCWRKESR